MRRRFTFGILVLTLVAALAGCQGGGGEQKYTGGDTGDAKGVTTEDATKAQPQRGGQN